MKAIIFSVVGLAMVAGCKQRADRSAELSTIEALQVGNRALPKETVDPGYRADPAVFKTGLSKAVVVVGTYFKSDDDGSEDVKFKLASINEFGQAMVGVERDWIVQTLSNRGNELKAAPPIVMNQFLHFWGAGPTPTIEQMLEYHQHSKVGVYEIPFNFKLNYDKDMEQKLRANVNPLTLRPKGYPDLIAKVKAFESLAKMISQTMNPNVDFSKQRLNYAIYKNISKVNAEYLPGPTETTIYDWH